ncbi:MAG TPA: lipoate--protein ligase family protein [Actinomycetota bacterium]
MSTRTIALHRDGFPEPEWMDTAVSHAILRRASDGEATETLRLHRPARLVAFGPRDRVAPGFPEAVEAARARGFGVVERLAGGRAAVFHEGTIAFSWVIPDEAPRERIRRRFDAITEIVVEAFRALGVDARVGEVPGEYCPGEDSVNARGRVKLMGVGQRVIARAAHIGGVIVVERSDLVRDALLPVYRALGIDWDPATAGSLAEEAPGVSWEDAEGALLDAFRERYGVEERPLPSETVELARDLAARHIPA